MTSKEFLDLIDLLKPSLIELSCNAEFVFEYPEDIQGASVEDKVVWLLNNGGDVEGLGYAIGRLIVDIGAKNE